jgi:hypothetical protein
MNCWVMDEIDNLVMPREGVWQREHDSLMHWMLAVLMIWQRVVGRLDAV